MWFLGHTAVAFGYALPFLLAVEGRPGSTRTIMLVPFFANLIDFLHPSLIRPVSHTLVAATFLPLLVLLLWNPNMKWRWPEAVASLVASSAAIVGDLAFGTFYLSAPLSWRPVGFGQFNSLSDLLVESTIGAGVLIALSMTLRRLSGPKILLEYRGRFFLSPGAAVFFTSLLFWAEVVTFARLNSARFGANPIVVLALLEMVCASLIITTQWVAALGIHLQRRRARQRPVSE